MHGGTSRGPITVQGLEDSRGARWIHGYYSSEARLARRQDRGNVEEQLLRLIGAVNQFLAQDHLTLLVEIHVNSLALTP